MDKLIETPRQMYIAAHATKCLHEDVLQNRPGRMRRITVQRADVRLLQGDNSARTAERDRFLEQPLRIAGGARQEAHVHEIETLGRETRRIGVALLEFHVRGRTPTGVLKEFRIPVDADDAPARANALRERRGDPARPAAEIEARPS